MSQFQYSFWWERLNALSSSGQVPMGQYGATVDAATAPWSVAQLPPQDLRSLAAEQRALQAQQPPEGEEDLPWWQDALEFGEPVFTALGWAYKQLSTKVLSPATHILPTVWNEDWQRRIDADSSWDALFDGRTWSQIMKTAEKDSWGRGFWRSAYLLDKGTSLRDPGQFGTTDAEMKDMEGDWRFKTLSGTTDFLGVMFLDPLWIGGKYVATSRLLRTTAKKSPAVAKAGGDYDQIMQSEPVARFLAWTDGRTPQEIAEHSTLAKTPQAGRIADLLSMASTKDKDLIYRIALGDEKAFTQLQHSAPAVAAQYARLKGSTRFYQQNILPTLGLSKAEQEAAMKPFRDREELFRESNRTRLKLAETEFMPFSARWLTADQARVYNTFATLYRPLEGEQARFIFNRSGELERTPLEIRSAMREFERFRDAARNAYLLTDSRSPVARQLALSQRRSRLGDQVPERLPEGGRIRGQQSVAGFSFPEAVASSPAPRGAERLARNARAADIRASRVALREGQQRTQSYQELWHRQLADYDPAPVIGHAEEVSRQLDLLDDFVTPELSQLNSMGAWYTRIAEDAADLAVIPAKAGIFGSVDVLPKGGVYAKTAELKAQFGHKVAAAYTRRGYGSVIHAGWMARPVQVLGAVKESVSRGATPALYEAGNPQGWRVVDAWLKRVRGLDPQQRMTWVRSLMGATTEQEKLRLIEAMEAQVVKHLLALHNVTEPGTVEDIVKVTLGTRKAYVGRLADAALKAGEKGSPRGAESGFTAVKPVTLAPDGTAIVPGPQLATQLMNKHTLLPVDDLDKALKRDGTLLQALLPGSRINPVMNFFEGLNQFWKTSVLFRTGYAIRTVSDEVLYAGAILGSLMYYAGAIPGTAKVLGNLPGKARNLPARVRNRAARNTRRLPENEPIPPRFQRGVGPVQAAPGVLARGLLDGPTGDVTKALIGTDQRALYSIFDDLLAGMRDSTNWGALDPKNPALEKDWLAAMRHALNNQLGKDEFARIFLRGGSVDEALAWLKTPQGRSYLKRLPLAARRREEWAKGVAAMVDQYTMGDIALMQKALDGRVSLRDLRAIPMDARKPVHGGQLDYSLGRGDIVELLNKVSDGFYTLANKIPVNTLVRHPVADMLYQRRLRELVADAEAQGVRVAERPDRLYHFEEIARQYTVKEMDRIFKDHLFSTPQTALKFAMPFFGAWRGALARWATAVGENPAIVARANQGWQGLHKPFDVVDEDGKPIEDPDSEVFGLNSKASIVMRLPEAVAKQFGALPLVGSGTEQFAPARAVPLRSLNTVLQGDPWYNAGFGPFVTVLLAEIVRDKPKWAQVAKDTGVLPFGARGAWWQHALPTTWQRAIASQGEDDRSYATTYINILRVETARYMRGERDKAPTRAEIKSKTESMTKLRIWESMLLPFSAQPMFYSKDWETGGVPKDMQFLTARLRDYKDKLGDEQGEATFLEEYPEAWLWTHSVSQNNSGIPANMSSWDKSQRVKHLRAAAPDVFASAVGVGDADYAEFDSVVYDAQMNTVWNPDTGQKYRETRDLNDFAVDASIRDGWKKFGKLMDYLRNQLDERKLLTLDDPGAEDLKSFKQFVVDHWSEQNPAWGETYGTPDPAKSRRVREQAWLVANDQRLASDPKRTMELKHLRDYLQMREIVAQRLRERDAAGGSASLTAKSNRDLLQGWEAVRSTLEQRDIRFSELWLNRHFGNDYLQEVG